VFTFRLCIKYRQPIYGVLTEIVASSFWSKDENDIVHLPGVFNDRHNCVGKYHKEVKS